MVFQNSFSFFYCCCYHKCNRLITSSLLVKTVYMLTEQPPTWLIANFSFMVTFLYNSCLHHAFQACSTCYMHLALHHLLWLDGKHHYASGIDPYLPIPQQCGDLRPHTQPERTNITDCWGLPLQLYLEPQRQPLQLQMKSSLDFFHYIWKWRLSYKLSCNEQWKLKSTCLHILGHKEIIHLIHRCWQSHTNIRHAQGK
jgi:hypothetical protein